LLKIGLVNIDDGTERGLERPKPRLVMPPAFQGILIDRTPDLFGADGTDCAAAIEILQARILEGQTQIVQQALGFGFGFRDELFVQTRYTLPGMTASKCPISST